MEEKIKIPKSQDVDTRSAVGEVTKKSLLQNTYSHISDVNNVGKWICNKMLEQLEQHDHTKIEGIDQFYKDFTTGKQNGEFKSLPWWQLHKTERHHLNDSVPEDVNLLDVLEMVIDCTVAGLARSGNVYEITIPEDILADAIRNTSKMIIDNSEIVE